MGTRWYWDFDAIDPKNLPNGRWTVGIPEWLYKYHQMYGHEKELARLRLVLEVLQEDTKCIYAGWSRPGKEDCFVFVGKPKRDHKSLRIDTPAPPGMLFLVFVFPDGTIDCWTWREASKDDPDRPLEVNGRLIWPQEMT